MTNRWAFAWVMALLLAISGAARAETPWLEWVRLLDAPAEPYTYMASYDIATDAEGNVFTAGSGFVIKHDVNGERAWHHILPGGMLTIAVDAYGDVYVAGHAYGEVDLDPGPGTWLTPNDCAFVFVVKLSNDGDLLWGWTTQFLPPESNRSPWLRPGKLTVDADGSVILAGTFSGTHDFGPEPGQNRLSFDSELSSYECGQIFVVKIGTAGRTIWAKQTHGAMGLGRSNVVGLLTDSGGDVVVHAHTTGFALDFGDAYTVIDMHSLAQAGRYDVRTDGPRFAYALAGKSGEYLWSAPVNLLESNYSNHPDAPGFVDTSIESDGESHTFVVAKLDVRTDIQWVWELPLASRGLNSYSTATDAEGNVFVSMIGHTALAFPATALSPAVQVDHGGVIAKLGSGGELIWVYPIESWNGLWPILLAANPDGTVSATGTMRTPVDFGGAHEELWVEPNAQEAVFVLRLGNAPASDDIELAGERGGERNRVRPEDRPAGEVESLPERTGGMVVIAGAGEEEQEPAAPSLEIAQATDHSSGLDGWFQMPAEQPSSPLPASVASGNAPWLEWIHTMGGDWSDFYLESGLGIAVDGAGNTFTAGLMPDEATASDEWLMHFGDYGYLAKHGPNGDLEWIVQYPAELWSVAVDSQGHVYAAGTFSHLSFDLNPGQGTWMLEADGKRGLFVVKFSNDGELLWAWDISGETPSQGLAPSIMPHSIAIDHDDALFIAGSFRGAYDFGPVPGTNRLDKPHSENDPSGMASEMFVCKLSPEGEVQWARQTMAVLNSFGFDGVASLVLDTFGHPVVQGRAFSPFVFGTAETDYGLFPIDREGLYHLPQAVAEFHLRINSDTGDVDWVRPLHEDHMTFAAAMNGPGVARVIPRSQNNSPYSLLIGKFDPSGDLYWSWSIEGDSPLVGGLTRTITDEAGNVFVSLSMVVNAAVPAGLETPPFELEWGSLILKLTPEGELAWAYPLWELFTPNAISLAVDAAGGVSATGQFYETVDFGGLFESTPVTTGQQFTIFTLKLSELPPLIHGDVNGDGVVNAVDVQLVINAALGLPMSPSHRADITGSGDITASDVQLVINAALGYEVSNP